MWPFSNDYEPSDGPSFQALPGDGSVLGPHLGKALLPGQAALQPGQLVVRVEEALELDLVQDVQDLSGLGQVTLLKRNHALKFNLVNKYTELAFCVTRTEGLDEWSQSRMEPRIRMGFRSNKQNAEALC